MESAFGIDHGEFEKAFKPPSIGGALKPLKAVGSGLGSALGGAGMKVGRAGTANIGAAKIAGAGPGAKKVGLLGRSQQRLGAGLNRVGTGAMQRPGLAGGLALGGGTAAVGGAGFGAGRRRQ
jgi:hypothetical protein